LIKPSSNSTIEYRCVVAGTSGATSPDWPADVGVTITDGTAQWERKASYLTVIQALFKQIALLMRDDVRLGIVIYGDANKGGQVWYPVRDLNDGNNLSEFNAKVDALGDQTLSSGTARPINEALFDGTLYFQGKDNSNDKVANNNKSLHPSPIDYYCQDSHVIVITTGSSYESNQSLKNFLGNDAYVMDVAKYAYENDLRNDLSGTQRLHTNVIQLATTLDAQLEMAADENHGRGEYTLASSTQELVEAFTGILSRIVREADTVFVAPVVPANPENQTYSGSFVYLGLFKPENDRPWSGNLKKFGLKEVNGELLIVDVDDKPLFGAGSSSCTEVTDDTGNSTVSAECNLKSYWSQNPDGSLVCHGGAGSRLISLGPNNRKIKTLIGNELKDFTNTNITASMLGLMDEADREPLINFVRGYNAFDPDAPNAMRSWLMGDVLHSRPLVVNYDKSNPDKTYIFVGTNGGMLHAFNNQSGDEEWAFIPPELLPRLQHLREWEHSYFVDGSASIYIHDEDGNGVIGNHSKDLAILIFGLRRGGGWQDLDHSAPHGAYYALNVTDPNNPVFLWRVDKNTPDFGELAQTWSQPQFAKVKDGLGKTKIVAFVGAGYDNVEDLRFGSTQTYPASRVTGATQDFSQGKSAGTEGASTAVKRGRGVYAIEIASIESSAISLANSGTRLWSFVDTNALRHSVASDILILDRNGDGFADRIYFGDMGGNVWRTNLKGASWTTTKIFSSNPGQTNGVNDNTNGRKLFYRLEASVIDSRNVMLYFGTGDREHPLNHASPGANGAVVDRLYAVRDADLYNYSSPLTEANLHDVTENVLQQEKKTGETEQQYDARIEEERQKIRNAKGWYIRLDQNAGEKVTAAATLFNNVVYFTTYQPHPYGGENDPCASAGFNLGTARLYAVSAMTGEAVFNFRSDTGIDQHGESQVSLNGSPTLRRADRSLGIGIGMPSGVVVVITKEGNAHLLIVVEQEGGGISQFSQQDDSFEKIRSLYWVKW
jgi:type IV pilus assembly protein PilY1